MGTVGDDEEKTPTVMNPCPECGSELVLIGLMGVPPPEVGPAIWQTIFAAKCVKTPLWRWCCVQGHLSVWVKEPERLFPA